MGYLSGGGHRLARSVRFAAGHLGLDRHDRCGAGASRRHAVYSSALACACSVRPDPTRKATGANYRLPSCDGVSKPNHRHSPKACPHPTQPRKLDHRTRTDPHTCIPCGPVQATRGVVVVVVVVGVMTPRERPGRREPRPSSTAAVSRAHWWALGKGAQIPRVCSVLLYRVLPDDAPEQTESLGRPRAPADRPSISNPHGPTQSTPMRRSKPMIDRPQGRDPR